MLTSTGEPLGAQPRALDNMTIRLPKRHAMTPSNWMRLLYVCLLAILISGVACTQQAPAPPASSNVLHDTDSTVDQVCKIAADLLGVSVSSVTASTSLVDLSADELDFVELVMEIEDRFEITISDEAIEDVTGIEDWQVGMKSVTMEKLADIVDDHKQ